MKGNANRSRSTFTQTDSDTHHKCGVFEWWRFCCGLCGGSRTAVSRSRCLHLHHRLHCRYLVKHDRRQRPQTNSDHVWSQATCLTCVWNVNRVYGWLNTSKTEFSVYVAVMCKALKSYVGVTKQDIYLVIWRTLIHWHLWGSALCARCQIWPHIQDQDVNILSVVALQTTLLHSIFVHLRSLHMLQLHTQCICDVLFIRAFQLPLDLKELIDLALWNYNGHFLTLIISQEI